MAQGAVRLLDGGPGGVVGRTGGGGAPLLVGAEGRGQIPRVLPEEARIVVLLPMMMIDTFGTGAAGISIVIGLSTIAETR